MFWYRKWMAPDVNERIFKCKNKPSYLWGGHVCCKVGTGITYMYYMNQYLVTKQFISVNYAYSRQRNMLYMQFFEVRISVEPSRTLTGCLQIPQQCSTWIRSKDILPRPLTVQLVYLCYRYSWPSDLAPAPLVLYPRAAGDPVLPDDTDKPILLKRELSWLYCHMKLDTDTLGAWLSLLGQILIFYFDEMCVFCFAPQCLDMDIFKHHWIVLPVLQITFTKRHGFVPCMQSV